MDTPIRSCMQRDVKGLYAKAMRCEITNFTDVTSPYEPSETAADPGRDEPAHGGPLSRPGITAFGLT
jgi:bifunctional enzyme CysN/CysC